MIGLMLACIELIPGDVRPVPHGYLIQTLNEFIRHEDALPSGDEQYWACAAADGVVALYVPRDPAEDDDDGT